MSVQQSQKDKHSDGLDAKQVAEYLQNNPEFFTTQQHVLADMKIPHDTGPAISLIEYQLRILREKNTNYRDRLQSLIGIARENDTLIQRLHALTLSLLDTDDLNEVMVMLNTSLRHDFEADAVAVHLFCDHMPVELDDIQSEFMSLTFHGTDVGTRQALEQSFSLSEPTAGTLDEDKRRYLFADKADNIASLVVLPLSFSLSYAPERPALGLVAVGSHTQSRFHESMGTVFLKYMGEMISRKLAPHGDFGSDDRS